MTSYLVVDQPAVKSLIALDATNLFTSDASLPAVETIQGRRRVYHPAHSVVPAEATRWEVEHLRAARYGAQEPFLFGGEISSFPDPAGGEGCAIVWPLEATD